jgi:carbonic anhydrase
MGEELAHRLDACHIARENEEKYEGEEQSPVNVEQCLPVEEEKR